MPLFPELTARSLEELLRAFDAGPDTADAVPAEEIPLWLDEAAVAIAEQGEAGLNALLQRLSAGDESHLRAILLGLSFFPKAQRRDHRARLERQLLPLLADQQQAVVAAAVDALADWGAEGAAERIRPLLSDGSPEVVSSALRFLARRLPEEAKPVLVQALASPESLVRENAVDELDEMGYVEALPMIRRLLNDQDEDVRQAARTAVANLDELQKAR